MTNLSDHFWEVAQAYLLSVVSLGFLASDFFPEPLLTYVPSFLSFKLLLESTEFSRFLLELAGELPACETSVATPITVTDECCQIPALWLSDPIFCSSCLGTTK